MKKVVLVSILWIASAQGINIINNTPEYEHAGYGNCNMKVNGEHLVLQHFLKDNFVLFAGGANRGDWTSITPQLSNPKKIYAFEPVPDAYRALEHKYKSNPNIHVYNSAISDKNETRTLYYCQKLERLSTFYQQPILVQQFYAKIDPVFVDAITLTSFCDDNNSDYIDFLKIDTEGAELDVLLDAEELLAKNGIGIIQFEYGGAYPDADITLKVHDLLDQYNYTIFRRTNKFLSRVPEWVPSLENNQYSNYLALPPKALEYL